MKHLATFSMVGVLALLEACGGSATVCPAKVHDFSTALAQARECNPSVAVPCIAYGVPDPAGSGCYVGVNPGSVAALDALVSAYEAAGCPHTSHAPCPSPPAYTCQAGAGGVSQCM